MTSKPTEATARIYGNQVHHRIKVLFLLSLLLFAAVLLSLQTGSYELSGSRLLQALCKRSSDGILDHLVWNIRLPRTIAAALAGSGLAVSGSIMQTVLKNSLAAPSTMGISQGAAFGAAAAIILLGAGQTFNTGNEAVFLSLRSTTTICAFGGALFSISAILMLSTLRRPASEALVLAGVAMGAFLSAGTMLLQYFANDLQVAATLFWTFGDLGKATWQDNGIIAIVLTITLSFGLYRGWCFNALQWGEEVAHGLGVSIPRLRIIAMVLTGLLVSCITAFLGIIAFIGLMAPHLARPFFGSDHRFLIPASALCGAILLLLADVVSRTVAAPVVIPVGIVTSFAGAPMFFYLLTRRNRLC